MGFFKIRPTQSATTWMVRAWSKAERCWAVWIPPPLVAEAALKRLAAAAHFEHQRSWENVRKNSGNSKQCNNVYIYIYIYWLLANNCIYICVYAVFVISLLVLGNIPAFVFAVDAKCFSMFQWNLFKSLKHVSQWLDQIDLCTVSVTWTCLA